MSNNNNSSSVGIGLNDALGLLFIGLKLGKVIDWSWWWVLSPFLVSIAVSLIALVIYWIKLNKED